MDIAGVIKEALRNPEFAEKLKQSATDVALSGGAGTEQWAIFLNYFASSPEELNQMVNMPVSADFVDSETYSALGPVIETDWTNAVTSTIDCAASTTTTTTWVRAGLVRNALNI